MERIKAASLTTADPVDQNRRQMAMRRVITEAGNITGMNLRTLQERSRQSMRRGESGVLAMMQDGCVMNILAASLSSIAFCQQAERKALVDLRRPGGFGSNLRARCGDGPGGGERSPRSDRAWQGKLALPVNRTRARALHAHDHSARKQRGRRLIQVLVDEIRYLLFQIGRVVQSRQFKRFQRRHGRLQKKLVGQIFAVGHVFLQKCVRLSDLALYIYRIVNKIVNIPCGNHRKSLRVEEVCCCFC